MSGVEEGGGEPSSGIPPTKKAPPLCQRRSLHGSFNLPADVIGSVLGPSLLLRALAAAWLLGGQQASASPVEPPSIEIAVEVGSGSGEATVWTCDLTHGYISINADYRS